MAVSALKGIRPSKVPGGTANPSETATILDVNVGLTSVSLLYLLRTKSDNAAWERFDNLYRPLIRRWLLRDPSLRDETEDLVQDVMSVLVREIPSFNRERSGSFRSWLRTITTHRLQAFWQSRGRRPQTIGNDLDGSVLVQLEDENST